MVKATLDDPILTHFRHALDEAYGAQWCQNPMSSRAHLFDGVAADGLDCFAFGSQ